MIVGITQAEVVLTGDTNHPENSMFTPGEDVELTFKVTGLPQETLKLELNIVDAFGQPVEKATLPIKPDEKGTWEGTLKAPSAKLGLYRVNARLSNGVPLAPRATRPAGFITYGVTFPPADRKLYPLEQTFFGMQGGGGSSYPWLGVRWQLGPMPWCWAEPSHPGQFAERRAEAKAAGEPVLRKGTPLDWQTYRIFHIIGCNCGMPRNWQAPPYVVEGAVKGWGKLTKEGEKFFADYCRNLAETVAGEWPEQNKRYYDILWEPDLSFNGDAEDMVHFFEIAYPVIHKADPKAAVIGPNFSCINWDSLRRMEELFEKGLARYIDEVSIHPYLREGAPENQNLIGLIQQLKRIVREGAGRDLPLIGTEFSLDDEGGPPEVELRHAEIYARQNLIILGSGFTANLSFYNQDCGNEKSNRGYFYNLDLERPYGARKIGPKPQALFYSAMTWLLEGHRSAGIINWLGGASLGYVFEDDREVILALWNYARACKVVIPVGVDEASVYDGVGNLTHVPARNGALELTLGPAPIYVRGVSPALWGSRAEKPVQIEEETVRLFPGDARAVAITVRAPREKPLKGNLTLTAGEGLALSREAISIELQPGAAITQSVGIRVDAVAAAGDYSIAAALSDTEGAMLGGTGCVVKVANPLELGRIRPAIDSDGRAVLEVSLHELRNRPTSGMIEVNVTGVPESTRRLDVALAPGEEKLFTFAYADLAVHPARKYDANANVVLDGGYRFSRTERIDFLSAGRFLTPPKIDGDNADWQKGRSVTLKGLEWCPRNPDAYSGDSATIQYGWDDRALYLWVEVKDKVFIQEQLGGDVWKDDCLQCGFSLEPWKVFEASANGMADEVNMPKQCEIQLALTKNGPLAWRGFSVPFDERRPNGPLSPEAEVVIQRRNDSTLYEARFPWTDLGLAKAPAAGEHIAVTIAVNDRDQAKQPGGVSALSLFNGATDKKDRTLMGLLYLRK